MARPGRSEDTSEDTSVPIWLKLSATDSAKMNQVLARPEFEGWTRGEWCLEIIQTALRYYTRPRPAGEPGRKRAPAPPAAESTPTPAETTPPPAETTPPPQLAKPEPPPVETTPLGRAAAPRVRPARDAAGRPPTAAKRTSPSRGPEPVTPERPRLRQPPEPEQPRPRRVPEAEPQQPQRAQRAQQPRRAPRVPEAEPHQPQRAHQPRRAPRAPEPEQGPSRRAAQPKPPQLPEEAGPAELGRVEPEPFDLAEVDSVSETECPHPAEARDYQSGTCAACGAILWD